MAGQEVRAYNFAASDTAALVGPSRGRLQGVLVNAAAAAAFVTGRRWLFRSSY